MSCKKAEFYFVVAPGTEGLAVHELEENWSHFLGSDLRPNIQSFPSIETHFGGISLNAELGLGLQAHFWLKLPVRILVRVHSFFADEFYQLEKGLQGSGLVDWLAKGTEVEIKVESQKSKLGQEKRVLEIATEVFAKTFQVREKANQRIYLRGSQNQWTLSLDATGEPLYKRNWAINKGEAPLRENLAATGWRLLTRDVPPGELRGVTLFDPFMGSGTCLFEAALACYPQNQRDFSFLHWKATPGYLKLPQLLKNTKVSREISVEKLLGADLDPEMIKVALKNLTAIQSWCPSLRIDMTVRDFWQDGLINFVKEPKAELKEPKAELKEPKAEQKEPKAPNKPVWVFTNPPYGQRIPWRQVQRERWLEHLIANTQAQRVGFLYPQKSIENIRFPEGYVLLSKTEFLHGGQAVDFVVLAKGL